VPKNTDIDAIVEKFYQAINVDVSPARNGKQEPAGAKAEK
jgi:hypothetical protein